LTHATCHCVYKEAICTLCDNMLLANAFNKLHINYRRIVGVYKENYLTNDVINAE
jgi:hypothetical protein